MEAKFRNLRSPDSGRKLAEWADEVDIEQVTCPLKPRAHQRGGKRLMDLSIVIPGSSIDDFVWTWHNECLIQDHILKMFREQKFSGFGVKPVIKARFKNSPAPVPRLCELVVTGWGGMARPESGVRFNKRESCRACHFNVYHGYKHPGLLIDEKQWDGSDFFFIWPMPKFIFVTDRVARFIRDNDLKGSRLVDPAELKPAEELVPGRLSNWMHEDRARKLGESLGIDW